MSIKLGEMLIEAGLLTRAQLDAALKNQVIFGGKLGTNLIELGYLAEEDLARFLSKKLELPCATSEQLMSIPPDIIKLIPKEVADKYKVIPISREKKRLTLAMLDPADLSVIDAISFVTGFYISPLIAPELRLAVALENYYGIKRDVRYIQLSEKWKDRPNFVKLDETAVEETEVFDFSLPHEEEFIDIIDVQEVIESAVEPIITEAVKAGPVIAAPVETEPVLTEPLKIELEITEQFETEPIETEPVMIEPVKAEPVTSESAKTEPPKVESVRMEPVKAEPVKTEPVVTEPVKAERVTLKSIKIEPVKIEPVKTEPIKTEPARMEPEVAESATKEPSAHTLESFAEELVEAKDREEIAEIITTFLGQEFDRVVLFMIKGTVVDGWKGLLNKSPIPAIENLQIPLDEPSVLKVVNDGRSFYLGPIPDTTGNARMLAGIGGGTPSSALLLPLTIMGRVVAVVYVDGGKEPVANRLTDLQKLVSKAGIAFEILILKNKILMT